jgi:tRNA pseudouridine(55) synthase
VIKAYKKIGETPLQLLERLRIEKPELKDEKLSYAGRLDPMAEGETLVLIGEENKNYEKHLGYDKEYEATFLVGFSTDTMDILGLTTNVVPEIPLEDYLGSRSLRDQVENLKKIKKQTYPWFSGMTVDGKKLFDHFKEGNLDIERPTLDVEIREAELIEERQIPKDEIKEYIFESIQKVEGDFRQEEILDKWSGGFAPRIESGVTDFSNLQIFKVRFLVSSGTFIRALTEEFDFPCYLLKLKRTSVLIK